MDKTAAELRQDCMSLDLQYPEYFLAIEDQELARIYNGVGAEDWPKPMREFITFIYRHFETSALIHDVRFDYSDGTIKGCQIANKEMFDNLHRTLAKLYPYSKPWLLPFRAYAHFKIYCAEQALSSAAGYQAYLDAFVARSKR